MSAPVPEATPAQIEAWYAEQAAWDKLLAARTPAELAFHVGDGTPGQAIVAFGNALYAYCMAFNAAFDAMAE